MTIWSRILLKYRTMNAYKKLIKNSAIFGIANMGSKLISILLVPFYTYVLTTNEYGTIDMITTTISLLLPLITLSIFDATLRFSIKSNLSRESIITSSIIIILIGNILFLASYPLIIKIKLFDGVEHLFYLIVALQSINILLAQFSRGIGKVKQFAFNGVLNTFITVALNIVLLTKFSMGMQGYFISIIISYLICNIYLILSSKIVSYINIKQIQSNTIREMLSYSIPLIPNSIMWWIMNASDRYAIITFLGVSYNGIYAIANKIPSILNIIYSIFQQAWQISAIEEGDSKEKSIFYTNVFNVLSKIMLLSVSFILVIIKPTTEKILSHEYIDVWKYTPFLLLALVFTTFSSFLGTNYIAMKKTEGIFKTSLLGALINIILNIILIPTIGLNGASISTMISFLAVWIIRHYDTKKFVDIQLDIKTIVLNLVIIAMQIFILYININYYLALELFLFVLVLIINRSLVNKILVNIL